jgi:hypothetical protein
VHQLVKKMDNYQDAARCVREKMTINRIKIRTANILRESDIPK